MPALFAILRNPKRLVQCISWRGLLLFVFFGFAVDFLLPRLDALYPVKDWLIWQLAKIWAYVCLLNLAFVSIGQVFVKRVVGLRSLPTKERLLFSVTIGVVLYTLAMYVIGALGGFRTSVAFGLAFVFVAAGAPDLWQLIQTSRRAPKIPQGRISRLIGAFGILCVGLLYMQVMTPVALSHDATWCHLPVAQDYAREGRIVPFVADYARNVPHLASIVHTWGFLMPGLSKPLTWMLALHMEFALFLWTLLGVVVAAEWSTSRKNLNVSWAAFFLFPILYVYDSNIAGGADHVLAFFSVPCVLSAARFLKRPNYPWAIIFGFCAGGASLTKYQAIYILAPLLLILGLRYLFLIVQLLRCADSRRKASAWGELLLPLVVLGVVSTLVVSPHFIKNWIFYANPLYPFAQEVFTSSHPAHADSALYVDKVFKATTYAPAGTLAEKLWHALQLFATFSFEPHYTFSKSFPSFGFLFTILLPTVLLVPGRRKLLFLLAAASGSLFMWAFTFNVDRNLQTFAPLLVASVAALLVRLWELGYLARFCVAALVLMQAIWNGDAFFYSGHHRTATAMNLIKSGYDGRAKTRLNAFQIDKIKVGEAVPKGGRILLHTLQANLGMDHEVYLDWSGFQGLIDYRHVYTARQLFDYYRSLGITHVAYLPWANWAYTKQEEVVFAEFAQQMDEQTIHGYRLISLDDEKRPAEEAPYRAVMIDVGGYASGLYDIDNLDKHERLTPDISPYQAPTIALDPNATHLPPEFREVTAIVVGATSKRQRLVTRLGNLYRRAGSIKNYFTFYLRNPKRKTPQKRPPLR